MVYLKSARNLAEADALSKKLLNMDKNLKKVHN